MICVCECKKVCKFDKYLINYTCINKSFENLLIPCDEIVNVSVTDCFVLCCFVTTSSLLSMRLFLLRTIVIAYYYFTNAKIIG